MVSKGTKSVQAAPNVKMRFESHPNRAAMRRKSIMKERPTKNNTLELCVSHHIIHLYVAAKMRRLQNNGFLVLAEEPPANTQASHDVLRYWLKVALDNCDKFKFNMKFLNSIKNIKTAWWFQWMTIKAKRPGNKKVSKKSIHMRLRYMLENENVTCFHTASNTCQLDEWQKDALTWTIDNMDKFMDYDTKTISDAFSVF